MKSQLQHAEDLPIFISTDVLIGCAAKGPGKQEDVVKDALIDTSTGRIDALIMESGTVTRFESWPWNTEEKCFSCPETGARATGVSNPRSGRTNRDSSGQADSESLNGTLLLSSIMTFPLVGRERTDKGTLSDVQLGTVGGSFVDARSGHVAYLATSVGGVLGIGSKSRVIPWSAVSFDRNAEGEYRLLSTITAKRLDKAPAFGDGADNLNNPEYRDTLYSYYGTRRAEFERNAIDSVSLIPVDQVLGATIVRGGDEKDSLKDLVLDPESGQVTLAVCANGNVVSISALEWDANEKHFRQTGDAKTEKISAGDKQLLASSLDNFNVMCGDEKCGDVEDIYFDTTSGKLTYLSVDYDGVRVLPWSTATVNASGKEPTILLSCSKGSLKAAPELDGKVGATIYSPAFRERVGALDV